MSLIRFIFKTDAFLGATPLFFLWTSAYQFLDKEPAAGWALLFFGACLVAIIVAKKAQHRRTLDRRNMVALVREMIHNANTLPFTLPQEDVALAKVDELFDNPLK